MPPPPFAGKVSKFFRRNSNKRAAPHSRRSPSPVYVPPPLSPVSEGSVYSPITDEPARPVPPPQHYHQDVFPEYDHPEVMPQSRLYETFSHTASEAATPLPLAVQRELEDEDEEDHHHAPQHHDYSFGDEMGYADSRSEHAPRDRSILIAPSSERSSHSSGSRGQRVTFIGDLRSQNGSASVLGKGISATRSGGRLRPPAHNYSSHSRMGSVRSERPYRAPRSENHDGYYEQRLPYMIFCDYGNGLEIGNEVDGFMSYEEYLATAHMRRGPTNTYFIIPGSTPVIFHDENGQELYRVDAQKYNTPTLRRRKYIIQDEFGKELFRIGNWSRQEKYGSNAGSDHSFGSHSPKAPRVMYLNSNNGSSSSRSSSRRDYHTHRDHGLARGRAQTYSDSSSSRGTTSDEARTVYTESSAPDILVMDENGEHIYDSRSNSIQDALSSPRSQFAAGIHERERYNYADQPSYTSSDKYSDKYGHPIDGGAPYHPSDYHNDAAMEAQYEDEHYEDEHYHDMDSRAPSNGEQHYHPRARTDEPYYD